MPFFQPVVHIKKLLGCVSLRVQRPKTIIKEKIKTKESHGKRVYLFTSKGCKGSITLEATVVTVIFMMAILSVIGYLMLMNKQLSYQLKINNVAVASSKLKFYEYAVGQIKNRKEQIVEEKNQLIKEIDLKGEEIKETDDGEVDIAYSYFYNIPWINKKIQVTQRCFMKDWTGIDITKPQELVYITKTGRVYHLTKECSHLSLNIRKVSSVSLATERNCYGQKYSRCGICVRENISSETSIFVTEDGTKYHYSLMCSGLLRNIITVEKNKVKDMAPCSKCAAKE